VKAGWEVREVPDEVRQIRERKSDAELEIMRCVNEATLVAIREVREQMYIGMKESTAGALMAKALTDAGFASQGLFTAAQFGGEGEKVITNEEMHDISGTHVYKN